MIKGIRPALAEGGKIKIGGLGAERPTKAGGTFRMPEKYSYFVITKNSRNEAGDLAPDTAVMDALPKDDDGKLTALPIVLHSDEIDEVFPTIYALYSGKKVVCSGDGEKAVRWEQKGNQRTGNTKEMACPCPLLNAATGPKCKPHGTLHCSIAAPGQSVAGAVHKWRTTSMISIERMIGSIQQIKKITGGTLAGLPLWLKLEAVHVAPDGVGSTVYVCHLELRSKDLQTAQQEVLQLRSMRQVLENPADAAAYRALIRRPALHESAEEMAEIEAEFYPPENATRRAIAGVLDVDLAPEEEEELQSNILLLSKAAAEGKEAFAKQYAALLPRERRMIPPSTLAELKGRTR